MIAVLCVGVLAWPFTVDDAFITGRYARHIASGDGYVFEVGTASTDGVTGPLWLVPLIVALVVGIDAVVAAKIVGVLCMALAAAVVVAHVRRRVGGRLASWSAAAFVAASPAFGTWGTAGLETGAATLGFALAVVGVIRRPTPHARLAGFAVGGLAWLRPELALAGAALLAFLSLRDRRAGVEAALIAAALALALLACRWWMFGDVLPLSFHAKPGPLGHGLRYALVGGLLATAGIGAALCVVAVRRGRGDDRALGWTLVAHAVAITLAGGDWMPGMRLWVPVLPAYVILASVGVARLARARGARVLAPIALALACALPVLDLAVRVPELRAAGAARDTAGAELARWLRRHARRVALVDIGYLAYASGVDVVDLGGLTDPVIGRLPGGHLSKRISEEVLRAREPDCLVLHSGTAPEVAADGRLVSFGGYPVERRVARLPWVREHFRVRQVVVYAPAYHYIVLCRL